MKKVILGLMVLLGHLAFAQQINANEDMSITKVELFWPAQCDAKQGFLSPRADLSPNETRYLGVQAMGAVLTRAEVQDRNHVEIEGRVFGYNCVQYPNGGVYHWEVVSLRNNPFLNIIIGSRTFNAKTSEIEFKDDFTFRLAQNNDVQKFFDKRDAEKIADGQALENKTFAIQYNILDSRSNKYSRFLNPRIISPYKIFHYSLQPSETGVSSMSVK